MPMSTYFGSGTTRGTRLQQVPSGRHQVTPRPCCTAASPTVVIGLSNLVQHHSPSRLCSNGKSCLRASCIAAASGGDEPPAARDHSSTGRRESAASDGYRRGGRGGGGRGDGNRRRSDSGASGSFSQWEGRREPRVDSDGRRSSSGSERTSSNRSATSHRTRESGAPPQYGRVSPRAALGRYLKDVQSCQELLQLLRSQPREALTSMNIATAWARLGNLQSKGSRRQAASASASGVSGGGGSDAAAADVGEGTAASVTAVVRQLLDPTAAAAATMDLRQISNTLWGMAKVGDGILEALRSRDDNRSPQSSSSSGSSSSGSSLDETLRRLQERATELLRLLGPKQPSGDGGSGRGGSGGSQWLDVRDATQLWYGMASLRYPWGNALKAALEEATIQAMEAALLSAAPATAPVKVLGPETGNGVCIGGGWVESPTAVAQIVFRMAAVSGAGMGSDHKARLAAIIDALSYDDEGDSSYIVNRAPLDNPDCLLVGVELLRLELPPAAVRRLHDMVLALPPAAAARTGRTAMARALKSATSLGLQPSASEARQWQQRLLGELGGERWTSEELSWTMLALSCMLSYLPDAEAREELLGALRQLVRQLRANDATRVQRAMGVWGLQLPEREAALLRQRAGSASWREHGAEAEARGGGGGGGTDFALRSWGYSRR